MQAVDTRCKASSTGQVQSPQAKPPLAPKPLDDLLSVQHEHESPTPIVVFLRADGRAAADGECNSACSPVRMHRRLDRTRAERRRRARYRVTPSANNDLHDTSSLLQSRRSGSLDRSSALSGEGKPRSAASGVSGPRPPKDPLTGCAATRAAPWRGTRPSLAPANAYYVVDAITCARRSGTESSSAGDRGRDPKSAWLRRHRLPHSVGSGRLERCENRV
jgi:hypothetical protein